MTAQELNRDVKRLWNQYKANCGGDATDEHFKWIETAVKPEIKRLYYADTTLNSLNANSLKMLLRLNLLFRVIPFHHFGLYINL